MSYVNLRGCRIGDADLACFTDLDDVDVLDLSETCVTDAGLEHLRGLIGMQMLILTQTQVTPHGVQMLKQALPQTTILYHV